MTALAAVILAAGAGRRLGGAAKALLPIGGRTYLAAIAATARALVDAVVVVGAPFGDEVAAHARELGLRVQVNPDPSRGMASSIALGFAALAVGEAAWLWPVDHPAVRVDTLARLVAALGAHDVAQPRYAGAGGHPPLVRRAVWPALAACDLASDGARGVLRAVDRVVVEVDDPGVVHDVDTPAAREALA